MNIRCVLVVEEHDRINHRQHDRSDVDQDLEERDHVDAEACEQRGEAHHVRDERQRGPHRLAQGDDQERADERSNAENADEHVGHGRCSEAEPGGTEYAFRGSVSGCQSFSKSIVPAIW